MSTRETEFRWGLIFELSVLRGVRDSRFSPPGPFWLIERGGGGEQKRRFLRSELELDSGLQVRRIGVSPATRGGDSLRDTVSLGV